MSMQIEAITVNAAELTVGRGMVGAAGARISGIPGEGASLSEQSRDGVNPFGPACKVTISEEGKALSRQQGAKQENAAGSAESARTEKLMLRLTEATEQAKDANSGLRQELNEIDKQILALNSSNTRKAKIENDPVAKEALEQQLKLREALKRQREYQMEESQRLAKEAGQAGMRSGRYREEIDENNRELVTLLKTIEESEKAREQREGGTGADEAGALDGSTSDAGTAERSPFRGAATHFMTASARQEFAIEDMFAALDSTANWFIETANSVTQSVLERSAGIRAAMEDGSFSDEDIEGMVEELRGSMESNYRTVEDYRGFGIYLQGELRTAKINHLGDASMRGVKEVKEAALQGAAAAALGEAGQSALDGASGELADEVKELIERRNDPERTSEEVDEDSRQLLNENPNFRIADGSVS